MSRKLLNKAISALLVLAICSTAFLGCVVNAATPITVKVDVAEIGYDEIVTGNQYATTVEFTSESAFVAGIFNVAVGAGFKLVGFDVKSVVGADDTEVAAPSIFKNFTASEGKVLFQGWKDEDLSQVNNYKKVTVLLLLEATANATAGVETAVTVSKVDVTDINEATCNFADDCDYEGSIHKHNHVDEIVDDNDASVKTFKCSACDDKKYELVEGESNLSGVGSNELASPENGASYSVNFNTIGDLAILYATNKTNNTVYLAELDEYDKVIKLSAPKTVPDEEGKYVFDTTYEQGVKSIDEIVKAVFVEVNAEGQVVSKSTVIQKSIAGYCYDILNPEYNKTDKEKAYAAALLDYATATQYYFDYKTDKPINGCKEGETIGEYLPLTDANNRLVRPENPENWKFIGANLTLTTKPVVRLYLTTVGETDISGLTFVLNYGDKHNVTISGEGLKTTTIGGNEYYYIDIKDLATKYLSEVITITCAEETVEYSMDTYAYGMRNTSIADAARYLYAYSAALAKAYPG